MINGEPIAKVLQTEAESESIEIPVPIPKVQKTTGLKHDNGKIQAGVLSDFRGALLAVAEVGTFGVEKYARDTWRGIENGEQRYTDALWRHLLATDEKDAESGLDHMAHLAWNILALLELKGMKADEGRP